MPRLAPRTLTECEGSQAMCLVEVVALDSRRVAKSAKPHPSTTVFKQSSSGAKRKRDNKVGFECLDVEGARKNEVVEPELLSANESSSDDDRDMKMPTLLSSSGTTISTSKDGEQGGGDSEEATLPVFKSYNPAFISPDGGGHGKVEAGGLSKELSPIRQMEVASPLKAPILGSQCLHGRKKKVKLSTALSIKPTGFSSSPYFLLHFVSLFFRPFSYLFHPRLLYSCKGLVCVDTTKGGETKPYTKRIHVAGKQTLKVGEEDVPNMLVLPKGKPVDVCKVNATPTIAIEDEEVVVVDLHSVQKSELNLIEQPLSDEDEPGPKMPTPVERMMRARAREVAEESPPLQSQKKKAAQAKRKVGGAAKKGRK